MEASLNRTVCKTKIDKVAGVMQYHDLSRKVYNIVNERYTYPQMVKRGDDTRETTSSSTTVRARSRVTSAVRTSRCWVSASRTQCTKVKPEETVRSRKCFRMHGATQEVVILMG